MTLAFMLAALVNGDSRDESLEMLNVDSGRWIPPGRCQSRYHSLHGCSHHSIKLVHETLSKDILCSFCECFRHIKIGLAHGWGSGV